jgi:hypothetical protein
MDNLYIISIIFLKLFTTAGVEHSNLHRRKYVSLESEKMDSMRSFKNLIKAKSTFRVQRSTLLNAIGKSLTVMMGSEAMRALRLIGCAAESRGTIENPNGHRKYRVF